MTKIFEFFNLLKLHILSEIEQTHSLRHYNILNFRECKFVDLRNFTYLCENILTFEEYERGLIQRYSPL